MKVDVQGKDENRNFEIESGENLLFAGLRNGVGLPYECATGTCGTCKARVNEGEVDPGWPEAPGRSYLKAKENELLLCQATTATGCSLHVPAKLIPDREPAFLPGYRSGEILKTESLTHDVIFFQLALDQPLDFEPGQFVVLDTASVVGGRAYSMVNYACQAETLHFVVKRKPGGKFSDWLFDNDVVGQTLKLFGPLGQAIFRPEESKNILCIGGGSGIAAMMSIVSTACQENYFKDHKGYLFFGVRTAMDTFFLDLLSDHVSTFPDNLQVTVALSDEEVPPALKNKYPGIDYATGFVHSVASERMAGKYDNLVAFVGGPPPMVDGALRMLILEARLPGDDIRYDKFG